MGLSLLFLCFCVCVGCYLQFDGYLSFCLPVSIEIVQSAYPYPLMLATLKSRHNHNMQLVLLKKSEGEYIVFFHTHATFFYTI